jgi:hypothetical protein
MQMSCRDGDSAQVHTAVKSRGARCRMERVTRWKLSMGPLQGYLRSDSCNTCACDAR